ncbi:hypothetical protein KC19_9G116300 [Ceratodon purpureus]|uniref:Secreted protein n=1 Tax=Ceratodon purpureus TaxID=3225 RepID=A0A8T0GU40_CERPU|nr:hypothetical protein KC19_9G116300 [Ceratodon purpureus]
MDFSLCCTLCCLRTLARVDEGHCEGCVGRGECGGFGDEVKLFCDSHPANIAVPGKRGFFGILVWVKCSTSGICSRRRQR